MFPTLRNDWNYIKAWFTPKPGSHEWCKCKRKNSKIYLVWTWVQQTRVQAPNNRTFDSLLFTCYCLHLCFRWFCLPVRMLALPVKVDFHLVQNVARATVVLLKLNRFLLGSTRELLRQDFHLVKNVTHTIAALLKLNRFLLSSIRELLRQKGKNRARDILH